MAAKGKSKLSKFRVLGKYFLLFLLIGGQAALGYTIIDKNYEEIHGFVNGMIGNTPGNYKLEEMVVNPADSERKRYLLIQITLEMINKREIKRVEENESKIKNDLIEYLSSQPVAELEGAKSKDELRMELIRVVNNALGVRSVRNLYYSKYVMQ